MSKELIERLKNEGDGVMSRREKTLLAGYIEELEKERDQLRKDVEMLREAVRFYADGHHFILYDDTAWDTVSGEPQNFQEDDANTAMVEDGEVARQALAATEKL